MIKLSFVSWHAPGPLASPIISLLCSPNDNHRLTVFAAAPGPPDMLSTTDVSILTALAVLGILLAILYRLCDLI